MNNSLQPTKENLFQKILNWFKSLFGKEDAIMPKEIVYQESSNLNKKQENDFLDSIRIVEDDTELLKKQEKFENGEILFEDLSDKEVIDLNNLYQRQIKLLKSQIESKKMELNRIRIKKNANS